jgi:hypothetical protein
MSESALSIKRIRLTDMETESVQSVMNKLISDINSKTTKVSSRIPYFIKEYKSEFKRRIFFAFSIRDFAKSEALRLMRGPIILCALGMNGQVLIALTGILGRSIIFYVHEIFTSLASIKQFPQGQHVIEAMLEKNMQRNSLNI